MRLTVNLDDELYSIAKSLAKAEDCSISAAVNRLLKRSLVVTEKPGTVKARKRNGFVVSHGKQPVTADLVHRLDEE